MSGVVYRAGMGEILKIEVWNADEGMIEFRYLDRVELDRRRPAADDVRRYVPEIKENEECYWILTDDRPHVREKRKAPAPPSQSVGS